MKILDLPILLASRSPRRSQLLREAGFNIRIDSIEIDEVYPDDLDKENVAEYLAKLKAEASLSLKKENEVLIASDTIVYMDGVIYGKPKSREEAVDVLQQLSGKEHRVITGVAIHYKNKTISFSDSSSVWLDHLSAEEIDYYVDNFNPYDKAGAYAIQEWIGHCKIVKIEGTYNNIMGLPVQKLYTHLKELSI